MKKTLTDIVPSFSMTLLGLKYVIEKVVDYINEKPEGGAVVQAQHLLNLGRVKGQSARQTRRERRKLG